MIIKKPEWIMWLNKVKKAKNSVFDKMSIFVKKRKKLYILKTTFILWKNLPIFMIYIKFMWIDQRPANKDILWLTTIELLFKYFSYIHL